MKFVSFFTFRLIGGMWRDLETGSLVLADVLADYELDIDYRTQFARIMDSERGLIYEYRAYTGGKITFNVWQIGGK